VKAILRKGVMNVGRVLDRLNIIQEDLDGGMSISEVARKNGVSEKQVGRLLKAGLLEIYTPFDENTPEKEAFEYDWMYMEDCLEDIINRAFDDYAFVIPDTSERTDCDYRLSQYLKQSYGNLFKYLEYKRCEFLGEFIFTKCTVCNELKNLDDFYADSNGFMGVRNTCKLCHDATTLLYRKKNAEKVRAINREWARNNLDKIYEMSRTWRKNNPDKYKRLIKARSHKKEAMKRLLVCTFGTDDLDTLLCDFGYKCSLTLSEDIQLDHFIPLSWGHGGTYKENLHPLDSNLNLSKSNKNPFEWIKEHPEIPRKRFDNLVRHFARANGLTPEDFRDFVYWCDETRRSLDEVKRDPRPSIVIWREATGKVFELPKYAIDELERLNSEGRRSN